MALTFELDLKDRTIEHALLCQYREQIDLLLRVSLSGLIQHASQGSSFSSQVDPIIVRLLTCLAHTYGPDHPKLRALDPAQLGRALQGLKDLVRSDIEAALTNDPATDDPLEVIFCYPGFKAVLAHRIAHEFFKAGLPLLPRMIAEQAHEQTGIDIHPGAQIGAGFFIDHGTGVVIGATAIIGQGVTIYQGVTLGAKRFHRDASGTVIRGQPRHPIIEDGVTIYAGASILGRITIGAGSVIGGNVWMTESVPAQSRITQQRYLSNFFRDGDGI